MSVDALPYPRHVASANALGGDVWQGALVRFDDADDRRGTIVWQCDHRHRLARTAVDCVSRRSSAARRSPASRHLPVTPAE